MSTPALVATVVGVLALAAVILTVLACLAAGVLARRVERNTSRDDGHA